MATCITAGRYASMLGFEAYEPTGLYQYSTAYDIVGFDLQLLLGIVQGVKYTRTSDTTILRHLRTGQAFGIWTMLTDRLGGDGDRLLCG